MSKYILPSLVLGIFLLSSCSNTEPTAESTAVTEAVAVEGATVYTLAKNTPVKWLGKKLTGEHFGTISTTNGKLLVEEGALIGGEFTLDMNSIQVLDLTDPGKNADLTDHLKSDDFFASSAHPEGQFEITGVELLANPDEDGNTHLISGNLTLKGIKQGIRFPANIVLNDNEVVAKASFSIDRTLWDIKYRSGKFFPELGDKVINDEIGISLELTASKA